jgi:hypothetical protein
MRRPFAASRAAFFPASFAAVSAIEIRSRAHISRVACARIALVALAMAAAGACARVKPYQREHLASPAMTVRFAEEGFPGEYRAKVVESKTGGGLPGDAPGGGCGCTQ